jgi:glycosyltransferase involved in cell wall biosynthesis
LGYRTDVPAILAASDIFVLPSHFEGLPMSVIEAMLTGLPVVATDISGPREQVVDGQTGYLVPAAQAAPLAAALQRLAADASLRQRLGAASLARAQTHFREDSVVAHTIDVLGA